MILQNKQLASLVKGVRTKDRGLRHPTLHWTSLGWMRWVGVGRTLLSQFCHSNKLPPSSERYHAFISAPHLVRLTKAETQKILYRRRAFRTLNRNIDDRDARPSLAVVVATIIRLQINMLKLSSVVRPGLTHARRTTTLLNRWISSAAGTDSSIPPPPVDGYTLSSGDTIPSVGLGTWRISGEDVGSAVKVVSEVLLDRGNPDSQF